MTNKMLDQNSIIVNQNNGNNLVSLDPSKVSLIDDVNFDLISIGRKYRKFVGPSQLSIVLGIDDFQSPMELKKELEEGYIPYDNFATLYGKSHESIAIYYYQKLYKVKIMPGNFVIDPLNSRFGGICDGLINNDVGIEIKCHVNEKNLLKSLPLKYKLQMIAYLYLYKRKKWILMSCIFNTNHTLSKYNVFEITWNEVKSDWEKLWYPQIIKYINSVLWKC